MRMKQLGRCVVAVVTTVGTAAIVVACNDDQSTAPSAVAPAPATRAAVTTTGSGFPSGAHYSLNIIGVPKAKSADMTGGDGHRIFVALTGNTRIDLSNADLSDGQFRVLDANGTDGSAAFQLPSPDPNNTGITTYSVYARALGKPGGRSTTTTCFDDAQTLETYCSVGQMVLVRDGGKSTATNVSKDLLYVYADTDGDGAVERYPLFSDALDSYFWSYDNAGLRLAQLRFYLLSTNVI